MALHERDFRLTKLPPIREGIPWLGGWMHKLQYNASVQLAVDDALHIYGRVPADEMWQVLGILVDDFTAGGVIGQGWVSQFVEVRLAGGVSPSASAGTPRPQGPWTQIGVPFWTRIWHRAWDGVTYLTWGQRSYDNPIIEPSNPLATLLGWPAGVEWRLGSYTAKTIGGATQTFTILVTVLRMLVKDVELEPRSTQAMLRRLIGDADMLRRASMLRG